MVLKHFQYGMLKGDRPCLCQCHDESRKILHCIPCCDHTYEKYSNECWAAAREHEQVITEELPRLMSQLKAYAESKR